MLVFLEVCDKPSLISVHKMVLRTIAVYSALPDSIDELDRCYGIEKLCDILNNPQVNKQMSPTLLATVWLHM